VGNVGIEPSSAVNALGGLEQLYRATRDESLKAYSLKAVKSRGGARNSLFDDKP
jgi:hypothetical protein